MTWSADTWGVSGALEYDFFDSIDQNGLIKTHLDLGGNGYANGRSGNIRITATSYEGEYQASFILTIVQPSITILPVAYRRHGETEWKYDKYNPTINFYPNIDTENFEYMVLAYTNVDAAREGLTWSVDNEDVLSITEMPDTVFNIGYVGMKPCSRIIAYAKGSGNVTITATIPNGQSRSTYSEVTRRNLESIGIYQSPYTSWQQPNTNMGIGETQQLEAYWAEWASYAPTLQWSSSNPAVLTVDENGMVTAVGAGTATITVAAVGTNVSATTATITVSMVEATGITINEGGYWDTFELYEGETKQLTATFQPENTTDKTVTWSSNNTSVATVDQNGLVTAVGIGTATITVTTSNGVSNGTNIRVKAIESTGITINEKTGEIIPLYVGDTYQLSATVLPENAGNKTVRWSSEDNNIARVSSSGLVKAMGAGFVNITARTNNGLEDFVTFEVTVKPVDPVYYTIRFLNYDGTELQNTQVLEGEMPVYNGATPTKPEDEAFTYEFSGWEPAIVAATANADYTATFTATEKLKDNTPQNLEIVYNNPTAAGASLFFRWSALSGAAMYELVVTEGEEYILNVNTGGNTFYQTDFTATNLSVGTHSLNWAVRAIGADWIPMGGYAEGPAFTVTIPSTEGIEDVLPDESSAPRKIMIDNIIYILRGEKIFTLDGQEVR